MVRLFLSTTAVLGIVGAGPGRSPVRGGPGPQTTSHDIDVVASPDYTLAGKTGGADFSLQVVPGDEIRVSVTTAAGKVATSAVDIDKWDTPWYCVKDGDKEDEKSPLPGHLTRSGTLGQEIHLFAKIQASHGTTAASPEPIPLDSEKSAFVAKRAGTLTISGVMGSQPPTRQQAETNRPVGEGCKSVEYRPGGPMTRTEPPSGAKYKAVLSLTRPARG